jgi:hypothetical protein
MTSNEEDPELLIHPALLSPSRSKYTPDDIPELEIANIITQRPAQQLPASFCIEDDSLKPGDFVRNSSRAIHILDELGRPTTRKQLSGIQAICFRFGRLGWSAFENILKTKSRMKSDMTVVAIVSIFVLPCAEAMPNGLLDKPVSIGSNVPSTNHIAKFVATSAAGIAVGAAYSTSVYAQKKTTGLRAWVSSLGRTIFGLSTLGHCIAWMVVVALIENGKSGLLNA